MQSICKSYTTALAHPFALCVSTDVALHCSCCHDQYQKAVRLHSAVSKHTGSNSSSKIGSVLHMTSLLCLTQHVCMYVTIAICILSFSAGSDWSDSIHDFMHLTKLVIQPSHCTQITMEELNVIDKLPHYCPVCAYHEWNLDGLVEMIWDYIDVLRIYTKPKVSPNLDRVSGSSGICMVLAVCLL